MKIFQSRKMSSWSSIGATGFILYSFFFFACTDYEAIVDENYEKWVAEQEIGAFSSSNDEQTSRNDFDSLSSANSLSSENMHQSSSESSEASLLFLTDKRDGQRYKVVTIGSQIWMAENLNYDAADSYCYDDDADFCTKNGRLYTWSSAVDSVAEFSTNGKGCGFDKTCSQISPVRGVCPEGWHLPSQDEWETLISVVGKKSLKSTTGWNYLNGKDDFSFSALPAGFRTQNGEYSSDGLYAYFWSSTESYGNYAYSMNLNYGGDGVTLDKQYKYRGYSVRCLQDEGFLVMSSSSHNIQSSSSEDGSKIIEGTFADSRDGRTYKTVVIGAQTWMAENLNFEIDGSSCYNNEVVNCSKYGRLYQWSTAMDSAGVFSSNGKGCGFVTNGFLCNPSYPVRGICPEGWHLPDSDEWSTLIENVGESTAGKALKSAYGWYSEGNGTDDFGFSALPAGFRDGDDALGKYAYFWVSEEFNDSIALRIKLGYNDEKISRSAVSFKYAGFSVRCIKDLDHVGVY